MKLRHNLIITALICSVVCSVGAIAQNIHLTEAQCVDLALNHSNEVIIAKNNYTRANHGYSIASHEFYGKITDEAYYMTSSPNLNLGEDKSLRLKGAYGGYIRYELPVYSGGRLTANKYLASINCDAASERERTVRTEIATVTKITYLQYVATRENANLVRRYINTLDSIATIVPDNDKIQIKAKRGELGYILQSTLAQESNYRQALCNLIGMDANAMVVPVDSMPVCLIPDNLITDLACNPDLKLLDLQVKASQQQVKVANALELPEINLNLLVTYYNNIKLEGTNTIALGEVRPYSTKLSSHYTSAFFSLRLPLDFWSSSRKIKQAKIDVENSRLHLEHIRRQLKLEASQTADNLISDLKMLSTAREAANQANENLTTIQHRYNTQSASMTDLLYAQSQWFQSALNTIDATTRFQLNLIKWRKITGNIEQ